MGLFDSLFPKKTVTQPIVTQQAQPVIVTPKPTPEVLVTRDYNLSPHFTYGMLVTTENRNFIDKNEEQGKQYLKNMSSLCINVLEPIVDLLKEVPHITSCFRCPELNSAIGGATTSQHMKAEAADQVFKISLIEAFNKIAFSKIPYSQIIFEFGRWVHVGVIDEVLYPGKKSQKLKASTVDGKTVYTTVVNPL